MTQVRDTHIESTLPKPWEREETFHEQIDEWTRRAPWLAISAAAHLVIFLILQAVPWNLFERPVEVQLSASVEAAPEPAFEDPPPDEEEPLVKEDVEEEPVLRDADLPELPDVPLPDALDMPEGDPLDFFQTAGFDGLQSSSDVLGIGGGWKGGKYGRRFGSGGGGGGGGGPTEPVLAAGLAWLAAHQDADGSWDCDGFMHHDPADDPCTGPGSALHDVGVTGLALLSFLGRGNTLTTGPYRDVVTRGAKWLREQSDPDNGLIGEPIGKDFVYDHAIATLALCEVYTFGKSMLFRSTAQDALNYISRIRNPYGAWRYDVPPIGDQDTSVTGWMLFALEAGEEAGLVVDRDALRAGLAWIDEVTDPATGRVGYDAPGTASSRVAGVNAHFTTAGDEAMTAVGLLCRFFLGQDPADTPLMQKHAELLLASPPRWSPNGGACDMYYWYYGTYAMYQMGGRGWKKWNEAMIQAVLPAQRKDGSHAGSWDPIGPWGHSGGRVYSTALMCLCLEVYFRYAPLTGAR